MSRFRCAIFLGGVIIPLAAASVVFGMQGACCIPPSYQCFIMTQQQCDGLYVRHP